MKINKELKEEMLTSMQTMFSGKNNPMLPEILKEKFPNKLFLPIIKMIPEQAEDIYWIMIDTINIAIIEIPRLKKTTADAKIEIIDIKTYKKHISSKESRRKLEAAEQLMDEYIKNQTIKIDKNLQL